MNKRVSGLLLGLLTVAVSANPSLGQGAGGAAKKPASLEAEVRALSGRIDALIDKQLKEASVQPAAPADEAAFFRRLHLDLAGKIPNLIDIRDYLDDPTPGKRWTWVEKLLANDSYARHFANVLRAQMITGNNNFQVQNFVFPFEAWLKGHLQKNSGYDQMVRELLTGQPFPRQGLGGGIGMPVGGNTAAFYFANENKPENLAGATARLFLGVKLECAQCHAHPFAKWTRNQFWEYAAFFTGIVPQNIRPLGGVAPGSLGRREIMIPGTKKVVKAKFLNGAEPAWKDGVDSRAVLADWITARDNPYFAKATVDLVWSYFFGVSLLEPILEERPDDNSITHPELLEELARQFTAHNYDLKFLIRAIVHSRAYQRSSMPAGKAGPDDLLLFARMPVRGLSPEQVFDSLAEAIEYQVPQTSPGMNQPFFNRPATPRSEFLAKFANQEKRTETQTSILQALFMMNGKFLARWTKIDLSMTREKLFELEEHRMKGFPVEFNIGLHNIAIQPTPTTRKIETMYLWVLSRLPRPEESERLVRYVDSGGPSHDPRQAISDVYWALLNSGEFILNH